MSILSTLVEYLLFWHKKLPKSYFQEEKALFFTAVWRLTPTNKSAGFSYLYYPDYHVLSSSILNYHILFPSIFCNILNIWQNTLFAICSTCWFTFSTCCTLQIYLLIHSKSTCCYPFLLLTLSTFLLIL